VKLLQNQSPEASHLLYFNICLKKSFEKFWKNRLGDPIIPPLAPRSAPASLPQQGNAA